MPADSVESGLEALNELISRLSAVNPNWNEAETRFQFIDPFLMDCLGWTRSEIHVERRLENSYSDYELGNPRVAILEAKREGHYFNLPPNPDQKLLMTIPSVMKLDSGTEAAIRQVSAYCSSRGTPIAIICNGPQIIAFLGSRLDGLPPLEGKCLVINGYDNLRAQFPNIWQYLSKDGIRERRIVRLLTTGIDTGIPRKLSSFLLNYPSFRYKSDTQANLRTVAELLIEDLVRTEELEPKFYEECYCQSGALARDALISKQILSARYASLFEPTQESPRLTSINPTKGKIALTPDVMAEALARRPIILIGDVGVGKTSFLKHLIHISAAEEFQKAVYVYIDLGSQAALSADLKEFVLNEIETQLLERYAINVHEAAFVRGVYNLDIEGFRKSIYGDLQEKNPSRYDEKLLDFLESKVKNKADHLRHSIAHIIDGRKRQVMLMLDNADQRSLDIQQQTFLIAQNLSQNWKSTVFLTVRPQTFHHSKQAGTFAAYPQKAFSISPPRTDLVIEKRLSFALDMAEGRLPVERIEGVQLNYSSLALFLKALIYSLKNNEELTEFLSNISGGNIRLVIDLVTKFIGSPNVDADKIIALMKKNKRYLIPVHELSKAALLGEYSHYSPDSSIAMNIYDVRYPDEREHFLVPMIISYLQHDASHRNNEYFVSSNNILAEMQGWGFNQDQAENALRRMTNKRLIETTERVTFREDITGLIGDMPAAFRITTVGAYHLTKWASTFSYLDAMAFDTPIFDDKLLESISSRADSFDIQDRYSRAESFLGYLNRVWHNSNLTPVYFDWKTFLPAGTNSFKSVKAAIQRHLPGRPRTT